MDWQQFLSLVIVGGTATAFVVSLVRRRKAATHGCGGACGCTGRANAASQPRVIVRGRRGNRPEVVITPR